MSSLLDLLVDAGSRAALYCEQARERPVYPSDVDLGAVRSALGALSDETRAPELVIEQLVAAVEPALVTTNGPRYFGFVIGGALDSAIAADMLTSAWDQNAFNATSSPAAAVVEDVTGDWLKELLGLPADA